MLVVFHADRGSRGPGEEVVAVTVEMMNGRNNTKPIKD